jgi:hypothetical protein
VVDDRGDLPPERRFGQPRLSDSERKAALSRGSGKTIPRSRFIANSVPGHVLGWLVEHELALRDKMAIPPLPREVWTWFAENGVAAFRNATLGGAAAGWAEVEPEVAIAVRSDAKSYTTAPTAEGQSTGEIAVVSVGTTYVCEVCEQQFERQRRARFCSVACQVSAWRKRAAAPAV